MLSKAGLQILLQNVFVKLKAYPFEEKLCVFHTCSVFVGKTSCLRGQETQLLLTHQKPHRRLVETLSDDGYSQ